MNKFDRVFSILIILQSRNITKAADFSNKFDVSLRTIYRDIKTLKYAGVPIIGDAGIGYSLMDGYRIPPMMFNEGETAALLTAEKFIGQIADKGTQKYYSSAMQKIKAILRLSQRQSLEVLDKAISISPYSTVEQKNFLSSIFNAIANQKLILLHYQKADGTTSERKIEPLGSYHQRNTWYLFAYCRLKEDYRTFKINRIVDIQVLVETFDSQHISIEDYIAQQNEEWRAEQDFQTIEIGFKRSVLRYAESRKHYFGFISQYEHEGEIVMKFLNSSIDIVARWVLQFGNQARVFHPPELIDQMRVLSQEIHQHYK